MMEKSTFFGKKIFAYPFGDIRIYFVFVKNAGFLVFLKYRAVSVYAQYFYIRILLF
ncbi:MAG: hypothetical protein KatS3mg028_0806 [Bacteroidia bacterium]|nr:MAG: hypothetical protein KatS3mg028_0806 [Bacteroidia bacterium]